MVCESTEAFASERGPVTATIMKINVSSNESPDNNTIKFRHIKAIKERSCEYRSEQTAELSFHLCHRQCA